MTFVERLRLACQECGQGASALARKAGVEPSNLSKFMNGDRGIGLEAGLRLYECLGYRLVKEGEEAADSGEERAAKIEPEAIAGLQSRLRAIREMLDDCLHLAHADGHGSGRGQV